MNVKKKIEEVIIMAVYENVFVKEFNDMMNQRRSQNTNFSIVDIPFPNLNLIQKDDFVEGGKWGYVKNIAEPYFNALNKTEVEIIKGRTFKKKLSLYDENGKAVFRKDATGEFVTTDVSVEKNFVAVYSSVNIHLPNRVESHGVKKEYKPTKGYRYIDYVDTPKGRKFLYLIPMECVYPIELCGLVIALNKHRAYYKGCKVALTNGHYVYIYSIPYKYRENAGYVLIGAKSSPDFDKEMNQLLNYWMKNGILFDLNMTALDTQVKGTMNIGIQDLVGTCRPEEYQKIGSALKNLDNLEESVEME